jgi:N-acetylneuraminic acid mutarotase
MLVYGGQAGGPIFYNGGRYVPTTDTWVPMTPPQAALAFLPSGPLVWTGSEAIIWGGVQGSPVGGRYHPSTDSWTQTSITANTPSYRSQHNAVWTGTEMIVWGGFAGGGSTKLNSGGRYSPATDSWAKTSTGANVPSARVTPSAVWTGSEMIVWGGFDNDYLSSGGRYSPSTDSWIPTRMKLGVPTRRSGSVGVWTGAEMIVWGGVRGSTLMNSGGRYDPATDSWTATSQGTDVPSPRSGATVVWTGSEMIVWGGGPSEREYTGGRYNPSTDTWAATNEHNSPSLRNFPTAVWTGTEMIIWGGNDGIDMSSGGRYDPATDSWIDTSTGANTPLGRLAHAAVWTGTEMIVWGGNRAGTNLNTGGRYSPATDTWAATSTGANVPQARRSSTAVWTGSDMIVWGGRTSFGVNTGGRYNAATDTWAATSTGTNLPAARYDHTAVWTGAEMIVWGGDNNGASKWNTGGRYDPQTDAWLATSTGINLPTARSAHSAVWTGAQMMIWGGGTVAGNPGIYCACPAGRIVYRDADGDGYGNRAISQPSCDGAIPAGYTTEGADCNDASASAHPGAAEICDALDNDCDGTADTGGSALCNDSDVCTDDACNGIAGCSHTFGPPEIHGVSVNGHVTTTLSWVDIGGGTVYDVVGSTLADLRTLGTSGSTCQGDDLPGPSFSDPQANPAPGAGYYYLIRAESVCGVGGYGFDSAQVARVPTADCP